MGIAPRQRPVSSLDDNAELLAARELGRRISRVRGILIGLFTIVGIAVGLVIVLRLVHWQFEHLGEAHMEITLLIGLIPPFFVCLAVGDRIGRQLVRLRVREWAATIAARHRIPVSALEECLVFWVTPRR